MKSSLISLSLLLFSLAGLLRLSSVTSRSTDPSVGTWYDVTIENAGNPRQFRGELLKISKDWVVLGNAWTEEVQMPSRWLQKLPFADELAPWLVELPVVGDWCYESHLAGNGTRLLQVHRSKSRVHFSTVDNSGPSYGKIGVTPPEVLLNCNVAWFDQGEQNGHSDRIDLAENDFDARTYVHEHRVEKFMDGQCPLIGDVLSSRIDYCRLVDKRISLAEVIYIESRISGVRSTDGTPLTAAD